MRELSAELTPAVLGAEPLPWQQGIWQQLTAQHRSGRLAHALLITGTAGCGSTEFADALASFLLCQQPGEHACGACKACLLFAQGTHPDMVRVVPAETGKAIKVDQIRDLAGFIGSSAQQGGYRVLVIAPADDMNINAANALLKGLEEPGSKTLIMLLSHRPGRMMPTIRSRCQQYAITLPQRTEALAWLQQRLPVEADAELLLRLAGGAPLTAVALHQRDEIGGRHERFAALEQVIRRQVAVSAVAARWAKQDTLLLLEWLALVAADLVRLRMVGEQDLLRNPDAAGLLQKLAKLTLDKKLFEFRDKIQEYRGHLLRRSNPNQQLLWEDLLIDWRALFSSPKKRPE